MANVQISEPINEPINQLPTNYSPRLWLGVVGGILLLVITYVLPVVNSEWSVVGLLGGLGCALLILLWWSFFSRVPWLERLAVVVLIVVVLLATSRFIHISIAEWRAY